jgi:hypothetical protein
MVISGSEIASVTMFSRNDRSKFFIIVAKRDGLPLYVAGTTR